MNWLRTSPEDVAKEKVPVPEPKYEWRWKVGFTVGNPHGEYHARREYVRVSGDDSKYQWKVVGDSKVLYSDTIDGLRRKVREYDAILAKGKSEAKSLQAELDGE